MGQDSDGEDYANWQVDRQFAAARLPIGRPSCLPAQKRSKYSAATETISLGGSSTLVTGKRERKPCVQYTDHGPSTRLPAPKVVLPSCPRPEPLITKGVSADERPRLHHGDVAKKRHQEKPSHRNRDTEAAARAERETAMLLAQADLLWANFSWKQRKQIAICAFAQGRADGLSKKLAARKGGEAARVNYETARGWVYNFLLNDGKMSASRWGKGMKIPSIFLDEEIILKSHKWWADRAPKRGEKNMRIADFRKYLCGDKEARSIGGKRGLFHKCLSAEESKDISEEMCRQFTINLGYEHADLRKGSFNDKHNSEENIKDRNQRFIPEYLRLFNLGPSFITLNGERVCVDDLADQSLRLNHFHEIIGSDGLSRLIDFCGELPFDGRRIPLLITHDESCFAAGEFEGKAWVKGKRQQCKDKTKGPSHHYSCFGTEYGNGVLCLDPMGHPPVPISIQKLKAWYSAYMAGQFLSYSSLSSHRLAQFSPFVRVA